MIIGVDIDDTITNTSLKIKECIDKEKISFPDDDYCNYTTDQLNDYRDFLEKNIIDILFNCSLKENSIEVINKLKEKGHKIYIITARSNYYSDKVKDLTIKFLKDNNILYDKLLFGYEDKKDICLKEKVNYMIDDNINIYNSLIGTYTKPILFCKELTKDYNCVKINNWNELLDIL